MVRLKSPSASLVLSKLINRQKEDSELLVILLLSMYNLLLKLFTLSFIRQNVFISLYAAFI